MEFIRVWIVSTAKWNGSVWSFVHNNSPKLPTTSGINPLSWRYVREGGEKCRDDYADCNSANCRKSVGNLAKMLRLLCKKPSSLEIVHVLTRRIRFRMRWKIHAESWGKAGNEPNYFGYLGSACHSCRKTVESELIEEFGDFRWKYFQYFYDARGFQGFLLEEDHEWNRIKFKGTPYQFTIDYWQDYD